MSEEATRSRVLVVGATGRLGGSLVRASVAAGHPTFALVRPHHLALPDSAPLKPLAATGAMLLKGSLEDYPSLLEAVRQVDVVICAVPTKQALEQKALIRAIKEAGCVKRFIPAEFGLDPTKAQICDMDHGFYDKKAEIRRLIESEGIPHTYISCNFFMRYLLPSLVQPGLDAPPRDEVKIFGGGNTKGVFVKESDVAKFTICTIEDPRTLNKTLYLRPPGNVYSMNELVGLWETKINKCLKKIYITEEQLLKNIDDAPFPLKMDLVFIYSAFVKGDHTYFEIDLRIEGTQLMLAAESNSGHNRHSRNDPPTRHKSGYEPSDTETEWNESPWNDAVLTSERTWLPKDPGRNPQVGDRRQNTSPNRTREYPDEKTSDLRNNRTPSRVTEQRRQTSPYAGGKNESHKKSSRTPPKFRSSIESFSRSSIKENISRNRSISTPKLRPHKEHPVRVPAFPGTGPVSTQAERDSADLTKEGSHAENCSQEINELIANGKRPNSRYNEYAYTSTESIPTGDIFFSRDCKAPLEKTSIKHNNIEKLFTLNSNAHDDSNGAVTRENSSKLGQTSQFVSARTGLSQTNTNSSYVTGRHSRISSGTTLSSQFNSGRFSGDSGKFSDFTGKIVGGVMKFTSNMQKVQNEAWLPCVSGKSCRKSKSPNCKTTDESESSFIQKAPVVEKIRLFWADKYCPRTLSGFTCHREQVQQLKQLVSPEFCPHIIFKGPPGSGKRSLCRAVLTEIFGDSSQNLSHYLKSCNGQGPASLPIFVPLSSSDHHVELNMRFQSKNARYALMALANEMASKRKTTEPALRKNFKVIVLYDVDKVSENNQRLIKWIIDSSSDACKIIMTCQDESNLLDFITSRFKVITIGVPNTREILEILTYISKKERFDLPESFAATIASQSRQSMREAILALEACKANNYPFIDGQAIPLGWEDVLQELAAEILDDPNPKRLFLARGKLQKLLVEFVPPKLILQKLVELFLKGIHASIKRKVYYWHAYYDKRLPVGASALLKLEEFVAKFMSIHRNTLSVSS